MRVQQFLNFYWEQLTPLNLFRIDIGKSHCHCLKDERPTTTQTIIKNIQEKGGVDMWTLIWIEKSIHDFWIGVKLEAASACPPRNWHLHDAAIASQQKTLM